MSIKDFVDQIYVINLDRDTERLQDFNQMMIQNKWSYERFPAIYGKQLTPAQQILKEKYVNFPLESLRQAEIGCLLSHVSLWEKVANDDNLHKILIFEDDAQTQLDGATIVRLLTELHTHLQKEEIGPGYGPIGGGALQGGYDILYLGKSLDMCMDYEKVTGNVYRNIMPLSLHAYILTKAGAQKLLAQAPFTQSIDVVVRKLLSNYNYLKAHNLMNIQDAEKSLKNAQSDSATLSTLKGLTFHPSLFFQNVNTYDSNLRSKGSSFTNANECLSNQQYISQNEQIVIFCVILLLLLVIFMLVIKYFFPSFVF